MEQLFGHWTWFPGHILVWGFIGLAIYWLTRRWDFGRHGPARTIFAERFARGEISSDEYRTRRRALDR